MPRCVVLIITIKGFTFPVLIVIQLVFYQTVHVLDSPTTYSSFSAASAARFARLP